MAILERILTTVPVIAAVAVASCGTSGGTPAWDGDGGTTAASSGGGGGQGSGSGGSNGGSAGSNAGSNGSSGGTVFVSGDDGGSDGGTGTGTGQACTGVNTTRPCACGKGTQTCAGVGEFLSWGPCIDTNHVSVACDVPPPPCQTNENGQACDAGPPPPPPPPPDVGTPPPPPPICTNGAINNEPEILVAYSPALHQTVGQNGQIKVWVNDENPPFLAPGEKINPTTGAIATPGNRAALAPDGLPWEPALWIVPPGTTQQNPAMPGGTPHFPVAVKGWYSDAPNGASAFQVPGMDPVPPGSNLVEMYTTEDIWDVSSLGLAPGIYTAVFTVWDGDSDRGIACVTIVIT